jgi:hypothetical protein
MSTDMTSLPTASLGFPGPNKADLPPLAHYRQKTHYVPQYGDYVVWSRWFSAWHGVVKYYNKETDEIDIIFAGVPFILLTMTEKEQEAETYKIKLSEIRSAKQGKYAILQQDPKANTGIWYV